MALDDLKQELETLQEEGQAYLEHTEEYLRLKIFKILMKLIVGSLHLLIGISLVGIVLLLLSFGLAERLGDTYANALTGYLIVAAGYLVIGLIIYLFRKQINSILIRRVSAVYFDDES
jgi:hypothetical protein